MTDEQVAKAAKLRKGGLTYKEISNIIRESLSTIYYTLNPDAVNRHREYREEHKEILNKKAKRYYNENRETLNEKARKHYKENIEESRAYLRNYYNTHLAYYENYRNTHKEQIRKYQREHPADRAASGAKRRALIQRAIDNATPEQLEEIVEIYRKAHDDEKVRCYLCGKLIPIGHRHVDHIIPLSKGGSHIPSNLAVACDYCNMSKHDKMPEEIGLLI